MVSQALLGEARRRAGLTVTELARRARTSRPTLSAYEHGAKSPTLQTAERVVAAAGFRLDLVPTSGFRRIAGRRGRPIWVPRALPRLPVEQAMARVRLPLHLDWSEPGRVFDMADRRQRMRVYEIVLREGRPKDIEAHIDGALLADAWHELVLPADVREAWSPLIRATVRC